VRICADSAHLSGLLGSRQRLIANERRMSARELGAALREFLAQAVGETQAAGETPAPEPTLVDRLPDHLGADPARLEIVVEELDVAEQPNVQVAIEAYLAGAGHAAELVGVVGPRGRFGGVSLSALVTPPVASREDEGQPTEGPIEYVNVSIGEDRVLRCLRSCLLLVRDGTSRLAVLVDGSVRDAWEPLRVEVMGQAEDGAERFLRELRAAMRSHNVYRGQVLALDGRRYGSRALQVRKLPKIERDQVILPAGLLERVERQTAGFARRSEQMLAAGRHLKRGILLHGPPGTGKTLTAMYLAGLMPDRTVLLLTGAALGWIERCCSIARALQPAMVVLEDVDLVAEERTRPGAGCNPLLFELLDQMDGLAEDADVIFLLTTNRPDLIEPALASRPGWIDQALEIPLPDAAGRRRLFELYGRGLALRVAEVERFVERTEGASAAFIRELLRRAALLAADEEGGLVVEDRHLAEALDELVVVGGELTQTLLGARARSGRKWHYELLQRGRRIAPATAAGAVAEATDLEDGGGASH
jgi:hypothetical protein